MSGERDSWQFTNCEVEKTLDSTKLINEDCLDSNKKHEGIFRVLYTNADSLRNKMSELTVLMGMMESGPDIVAVTEIKNKNRSALCVEEILIRGYDIYVNDISNDSNRGVAIYVKRGLKTNVIDCDIQYKEFQMITRNTPIGVVLREPLVEFDLTKQFCNNHDYIWI